MFLIEAIIEFFSKSIQDKGKNQGNDRTDDKEFKAIYKIAVYNVVNHTTSIAFFGFFSDRICIKDQVHLC